MVIERKRAFKPTILTILLAVILLAALPVASFAMTVELSSPVEGDSPPPSQGNDHDDELISAGYRPRFPYPGSDLIQTPEPVPDGAIWLPFGKVPNTFSSPSRQTYVLYHDAVEVNVYVDIAPGQLTSNEKLLLDAMIDDFKNYSFIRVKDYFDPSNLVSYVDWRVWKIDGPSGVGGFYQPGTNEFNVDRDDLSWGGVIAAHEFEHYVHRQYDLEETLWVDEGCADYGAYLVYGIDSAVATHVYSYLEYKPLNTLTVTDSEFYNDYTTSQYGTSFLFQLYMTHQYGGKDYTRALVKATNHGSNGVTRALQTIGSTDTFSTAFAKWKVATRLNDATIGPDGNYSYPVKTYAYGSLNVPITASHSGVPSASTRNIGRNSITTIRFSGPPTTTEDLVLKLTFSAGAPDVVIYKEVSGPRDIISIDFAGGRSADIQMNDWGKDFSAFQIMVSSSESSSFSYELDIVDLIPPITSIDISPSRPNGENGWYVSSPKITLTSEPFADIKYGLNGGAAKDYTGAIYLADGNHNLSFYSIDKKGNTEVPRFRDLKVDATPPTSSIKVEPDNPSDVWLNSRPLITLTTSFSDAKVEYRFGNAQYSIYTQPLYPPEGESTLVWRAFDNAGNREMEYQRSFKVDTVAPTVEHLIYPQSPNGENGYYSVRPQLTLSTPDGISIYYTVDGSEQRLYEAPFEVKDGLHVVRFMASDKAGNVGDEIRMDLKVDTAPPTVTGTFDGFVYDLENSSKWQSANPILNLGSSESGTSINYTLNGNAPTPYTEPVFIPDGQYEVVVNAKDPAGNTAQPLIYYLKVDTKRPYVTASISTEQKNGWYVDEGTSVALKAEDENNASSTARILFKWGSGEAVTYRNPIKVPEGRNKLTYWAEDLAGNRMDPRTIELNKDSLDPSVAVVALGLEGGSIIEGGFVLIDLSASTDEGGIALYGLGPEGSIQPDWTAEPVFNRTFDEPGTFNITLFVRDLAGNVGSKVLKVIVKEKVIEDRSTSGGSELALIIGFAAAALVLIVVLAVLLILMVSRRNRQHQSIHQLPPRAAQDRPHLQGLQQHAPHAPSPASPPQRPNPAPHPRPNPHHPHQPHPVHQGHVIPPPPKPPSF